MQKEIFQSLLSSYQIGLETSMRGSDFIFDCVNLLYYKCHKINIKHGGSYIDSPGWIKKKKTVINPKIKMISVFNRQQQLHWIMEKLSGTQKEFQILNHCK